MNSSLPVIVEHVIPELKEHFPDIPKVEQLTALESLTRLRQVICSWVFFSSELLNQKAIIMFIDDLQWGDENSISIINALFALKCPIFFFFAVRDNEIHEKLHVKSLISTLASQNPLRKLILEPLDASSVTRIVGEMTGCSENQIESLAKIVAGKTRGNPFFVIQFVGRLYDEGILNFNVDSQKWEYNIDRINAMPATTNVISLLVDEIEKLPDSAARILQMASCIGSTFSLSLLREISDLETSDILEQVSEVLNRGFIQPKFQKPKKTVERSLYLSQNCVLRSEDSDTDNVFVFLHDRVHEGFYLSIPETRKVSLHYKIGRTLMKDGPTLSNVKTFRAVHNLYLGREKITDQAEVREVVDLFIRAANLAMSLGSSKQILSYALNGREILQSYYQGSEDLCWSEDYDRSYKIHLLICDTSAGSKELNDTIEEHFNIVDRYVQNPRHRLEFHHIHINSLNNKQQFDAIVKNCLVVMNEYGYSVNEHVTEEEVEAKLQELEASFCGRHVIDVFASVGKCEDELLPRLLEYIVMAAIGAYLVGNFPFFSSLMILCVQQT